MHMLSDMLPGCLPCLISFFHVCRFHVVDGLTPSMGQSKRLLDRFRLW